jgi:hypothetical protein
MYVRKLKIELLLKNNNSRDFINIKYEEENRCDYCEDGGSTFLRNVGKHLQDYTMSHSEHSIVHSHRRENLKSHNKYQFILYIKFSCHNVS